MEMKMEIIRTLDRLQLNSEEQINDLAEALHHALHPVDRDIKVALVRKGFRALKNFRTLLNLPTGTTSKTIVYLLTPNNNA